MDIKGFIHKWLPYLLTLLGVGVYLAFTVHFAITQRSTIDEGLTLFKGYLFASGRYVPYQDFGLRTMYGPLAYLVPGVMLAVFGPGLLTGRIFAIILGLVALAGLWATVKRLTGPWWATAAVWVVTINLAYIRFFSFGLQQGIVVSLMMWMIFLAVGTDRPAWQTSLSAVLASLILFTRQNIAPVLPLLLLYIFWQYGRRQGLQALLAAGLVVIAGHAAYWPGILQMWAPWLPSSLTPFLDVWRLPSNLTPSMSFDTTWTDRLFSLFEGFRFHFVSLAGFILGLVLWPTRQAWKSTTQYKTAVFLAVLFLTLLAMSLWAGLGFTSGNNTNAWTFNPYLAYFSNIGLIFIILLFSNFRKSIPVVYQVLVILLVVAISTGIGFGTFERTGQELLKLSIPRVRDFFTTFRFLPGHVSLDAFLYYKYGFSYETSRRVAPAVAGFLIGVGVLVAGFIAWLLLNFKRKPMWLSLGSVTAALFLLVGISISPTFVLGGGFTQWDCTGNVIRDYRTAGAELAQIISPQDKVFWFGGNAVAVLLYAPGIQLEPQELDGRWTYFQDGDPVILSRLGFWNKSLNDQWLSDANVILIQSGSINGDWQETLETSGYSKVGNLAAPLNCTTDSNLTVWRRGK